MLDRRDFLKLAAVGGGAVFMSGLQGCASALSSGAVPADFHFVQLSDTHWGFEGPVNPDARGTLKKAVASVNSMTRQPDFVMFTGDLKVKDVRFMPGEHDASLDNGKAFIEFFGPTHYTFDHKGVHFIVVDNVS